MMQRSNISVTDILNDIRDHSLFLIFMLLNVLIGEIYIITLYRNVEGEEYIGVSTEIISVRKLLHRSKVLNSGFPNLLKNLDSNIYNRAKNAISKVSEISLTRRVTQKDMVDISVYYTRAMDMIREWCYNHCYISKFI